MLSKQMVVLLVALVFATSCRTYECSSSRPTARAGTLILNLPSFASRDELISWASKSNEDNRVVFQEIGKAQVAVFVVGWGSGIRRDVVHIYAWSPFSKRWVVRVLWNTEMENIKIEDKKDGQIEVHAASGEMLFRFPVAAFALD
jgi:hypothetical protein